MEKKEKFEDVISVRGTIKEIFRLPNGVAVIFLDPAPKSKHDVTEVQISPFMWKKLELDNKLTEEMEVIIKLDLKGDIVDLKRLLQ